MENEPITLYQLSLMVESKISDMQKDVEQIKADSSEIIKAIQEINTRLNKMLGVTIKVSELPQSLRNKESLDGYRNAGITVIED